MQAVSDKTSESVLEALSFGDREHLALVGAGGKTSTMLAVSEELRCSGKEVAATTTTKVAAWEAMALCLVLLDEEDAPEEELRRCLQEAGSVFVGQRLTTDGKVQGVSPAKADEIFGLYGHLVTEADGAAQRPVKVPGDNEPVVPASSTHVVAVMGCDAVGRAAGPDIVFRFERFLDITGLRPGEEMTTQALVRIFLDPSGLFKGAPRGAKRSAFLNKVDMALEYQGCLRLAEMLLCHESSFLDRVILGSVARRRFQVFRR